MKCLRPCFFWVLTALSDSDCNAWCMTLWSLWQSKNKCVWENKHVDANAIIWDGRKLLLEWTATHDVGGVVAATASSSSSTTSTPDVWKKPLVGWVKCNVDASFSLVANKVGFGIALGMMMATLSKQVLVGFLPLQMCLSAKQWVFTRLLVWFVRWVSKM